MPAYKDKEKGTWYASFYYEDWTGKKVKKLNRGFSTKRDALEWERTFLQQQTADLEMTFENFVALYAADMKGRIKENTWGTKEHISWAQTIRFICGLKSLLRKMKRFLLTMQYIPLSDPRFSQSSMTLIPSAFAIWKGSLVPQRRTRSLPTFDSCSAFIAPPPFGDNHYIKQPVPKTGLTLPSVLSGTFSACTSCSFLLQSSRLW